MTTATLPARGKAFKANVELSKLFGLRQEQRELVHEGQV